jgi:hypothetical protein
MSKEEEMKVLDKVKKLMALGDSPNEAEAQSAVMKAHALLKQYNLEMSDIEVEEADVIDVTYMDSGRTQGWKVMLMNIITKFNYCALYRKHGASHAFTFQFVGKEHNVAVASATADYLLKTIDRLGKTIKGSGRSEIESYKAGIADTLIARMTEMMKKDKIDVVVSGVKDLVVQEEVAVKKFMDNLKLGHFKTQKNVSNWGAYQQGRQDGHNVSLNHQVGGVSSRSLAIGGR